MNLFTGAALLAVALTPPQTQSVSEIERASTVKTVGVFYLATPEELIKLERQAASSHIKARTLGLRGNRVFARLTGSTSPIRVSYNRRPVFLVRLVGSADPTKYRLFVLTPKKGYRELELARGTWMGAKGTDPTIPCDIERIGETEVFRFSPATELAAGEYAFSPDESADSFAFGVGAPGKQ